MGEAHPLQKLNHFPSQILRNTAHAQIHVVYEILQPVKHSGTVAEFKSSLSNLDISCITRKMFLYDRCFGHFLSITNRRPKKSLFSTIIS